MISLSPPRAEAVAATMPDDGAQPEAANGRMQAGRMRLLKVLVVVMGVLIVAATATLGVLIIRRVSGTPTAGSTGAAVVAASAVLDEPAGTRIASVSGLGDRLVLRLEGGGPDRVLVIDPRSGLTTARIGLAH